MSVNILRFYDFEIIVLLTEQDIIRMLQTTLFESDVDQSTTSANSYKCKPFIKWAGGKTQLLPVISKNLPPSIQSKQYYVEPFIGSGSVLFWLLKQFSNFKVVVINDINYDLITAYRVIKKSPNSLIKYLKSLEQEYYSIRDADRGQYYYKQREVFNKKIGDQIEQTALLIFLNRTCYNGLYRVNSRNKFNVPFGKYKKPRICDEETIRANSRVLQKVKIVNKDFTDTIEFAGKRSYYYFDPPYKPISTTSFFKSYASNGFGDDEQIRLAEFCKKLNNKGTHWLLSNSDVKNTEADNNFFDELYKDFNIRRVEARRNINSDGSKRGKIFELLISNY